MLGLAAAAAKFAAMKRISQGSPEPLESAAHLKEVRLTRGLPLFNKDFKGWYLS